MVIDSELFLISTESLGSDGQDEKVLGIVGPLAVGFSGIIVLGDTKINYTVSGKRSVLIGDILQGTETVYSHTLDGDQDRVMELKGRNLDPDKAGTVFAVFAEGINKYLCLNLLGRRVGDIIQDGKLNS